MSYILYYSPDSANLVIRMALEEMGLPYESVHVDRSVNAQTEAAFLALNPQGLLPVLVDSTQDAPLFETAAILLHLSERHGALAPSVPAQRGRFLKWLFFISNTLHADLRALFYSERYVAQSSAVPLLRLAMHQRVTRHLVLLDAEIARHGGTWLMGESLTVCDFYLAACVRWAQLYPRGDVLASENIFRQTHLCRLVQALQQRPSVQRAFQQEGIAGDFFIAPDYPL